MRARNIKPGFFESDVVASVGFMERVLFAGLWCMADREGRLEDRPRRIRGELFRYDDLTDADVDEALAALVASGLIVRYEMEEHRVIWIPGFQKHQRPHANESESSIYAYGDECSTYSTLGTKVASACDQGDNHFALIPDPGSLIPDPGMRNTAEPRGARSAPVDDSPVIGTIQLADGSDFAFTERMAEPWRPAYPGCDIAREIAKARAWCIANPTKRKTRRGALKFMVGWLERSQNSGRTGSAGSGGIRGDTAATSIEAGKQFLKRFGGE